MTAKINILEFSNQWGLGGTEKSAQLFIQYIDKSIFNIFVAGWAGGERLKFVEQFAEDKLISENPAQLIEWIKSKKIDLVHFHRGGSEESKAIEVFTAAGVNCLIEHNIFGQYDSGPDESKINKHIFVSNIQKELYKIRAGVHYDESKAVVLYNPIEADKFKKASRIDYSKPIFGRHSRVDPCKWHPLNVLILPRIKRAVPEAKFHVIGLPGNYRDAINNLGCMDMVVEFPVTVDENEIKNFLNGITVFTHGSEIGESFGMGIAEAMAIGLPVVTHFGGDSAQAELVTDGFNGFISKQDDIDRYADNVIELLLNPHTKLELGLNGQNRALQRFEASQQAAALQIIFIETLNGKMA